MPGRNKTPMTVAAAGNIKFMTAAEVRQQPAALCTVAGMIALKPIQFFTRKTGQVFLHAGSVKIAGQMSTKSNTSRVMDHLHNLDDTGKIGKAQVIFCGKYPPEKILPLKAIPLPPYWAPGNPY